MKREALLPLLGSGMGIFQRIDCCCTHRRQRRSNFLFLRFCCAWEWCHGDQLEASGNDSFNNSNVHLLQNLWFVKGPAWFHFGFQQ